MEENRFIWICIAIVFVIMLLFSSCDAAWWYGHDNGEAYMRYEEDMQKFAPDIYGYGWGPKK